MSKLNREIRWVCGFVSENVETTFFEVGKNDVTSIKYREDNYGDHGLGWFDVYFGDAVEQSIAARAVAEVRYFATVKAA